MNYLCDQYWFNEDEENELPHIREAKEKKSKKKIYKDSLEVLTLTDYSPQSDIENRIISLFDKYHPDNNIGKEQEKW